MDSEWKPDDSHLEREGKAGTDAIDDVLQRHNLSLDRIFTSRDLGVDMARYELRKPQPPGWQSWQLPAYPRSKVTFFFPQAAHPRSILPEHEHDVAQIRLIHSGHVVFNRNEIG